jgi:hypothetical protein
MHGRAGNAHKISVVNPKGRNYFKFPSVDVRCEDTKFFLNGY